MPAATCRSSSSAWSAVRRATLASTSRSGFEVTVEAHSESVTISTRNGSAASPASDSARARKSVSPPSGSLEGSPSTSSMFTLARTCTTTPRALSPASASCRQLERHVVFARFLKCRDQRQQDRFAGGDRGHAHQRGLAVDDEIGLQAGQLAAACRCAPRPEPRRRGGQRQAVHLFQAHQRHVVRLRRSDVEHAQSHSPGRPAIAQLGDIRLPAGPAQVGHQRHFVQGIGTAGDQLVDAPARSAPKRSALRWLDVADGLRDRRRHCPSSTSRNSGCFGREASTSVKPSLAPKVDSKSATRSCPRWPAPSCPPRRSPC